MVLGELDVEGRADDLRHVADVVAGLRGGLLVADWFVDRGH